MKDRLLTAALIIGTTQAEDFAFDYGNGLRVHLIDTPGFDDTNKSDTDVLKDIATWLTQSYKRKECLSGILFLHPISAAKFTGGARRNLAMFKRLCGEDCFPSVVLATSRWDEVKPDIGEAREQQLKSTPGMWLEMVEAGSHYMRHDRREQSAMEILDHMVKSRRVFTAALQEEMVEKGVSLQNTQAGQQLSADLLAAEERHREELVDLQKKYEDARKRQDYEAQERLQRLREETQSQLEAEQRARSELTASLETIRREKQEETRRSQADAAKQLAEMSKMRLTYKKDKQEMEGQLKGLHEQLESLGRKNAARAGEDCKLISYHVIPQAFPVPY